MFAIRDLRNGVRLENTTAPAPPGEVWAHVRQSSANAYGGTTNSGNVWIWSEQTGFNQLNRFQAYGGWALNFGYNGYVYWQEEGYGVLRRLLGGGIIDHLTTIQPAASGLLDVTPENVVIPDFGQGLTFTRRDGSVITIPKGITRNGVTVGYANNMPGAVEGIAAYLPAVDELYQVWKGDPLSLPVRLDDDGQTVAVSGDLANGFIPRSQWTLIQAQPPLVVHPPTPLTKPAMFCAFLASGITDRPSWANSHIMKDGTEMIGADGQRWNVRLLEAGTGSTEHPCIYVGSPADVALLPLSLDNPYDVLSPWIYRGTDESDIDYHLRAAGLIEYFRNNYPRMQIAPIWNATTRIGDHGPTLTQQQALDSLTIGSTFGLPALIFEAGRAGFVPEAAQLLTDWRNGQSCPAPMLPPQSGLAARKLLLT